MQPWQPSRLVKNLMLRNVVMLIWWHKEDLIVKKCMDFLMYMTSCCHIYGLCHHGNSLDW